MSQLIRFCCRNALVEEFLLKSERLLSLNDAIDWPANVWMGVSVENEQYVHRIDHLCQTDARVRFLSLEPLLGLLPGLDLRDIHWVIVGGESGSGARPIQPIWVTDIRDQCVQVEAPFFFKHWGGVFKKRTGRVLQGRTWDEMPSPTRQTVSDRLVIAPSLPAYTSGP